ncbi:hypothetical protein TB2_017166 [Malus domestica]
MTVCWNNGEGFSCFELNKWFCKSVTLKNQIRSIEHMLHKNLPAELREAHEEEVELRSKNRSLWIRGYKTSVAVNAASGQAGNSQGFGQIIGKVDDVYEMISSTMAADPQWQMTAQKTKRER